MPSTWTARARLLALVAAMLVSAAATVAIVDFRRGRLVPGPRLHLDTLDSATLGERRELIVHLPISYAREPTRRYPVIYVLDGSSLDLPTADAAALLARTQTMPEAIVVGLPNVSGEGRQRDYTPPFMRQDVDVDGGPTGRADAFLRFLGDELIPHVERGYRTSGQRLLSGHSRGGLLVCYSLVAAPTLFTARFAHSPALWRDDFALLPRLADALTAGRLRGGYFYLSVGGDEIPRMLESYDRLRRLLTERAAGAGLRWDADVVSGADHQANGPWATPLGLKRYYDDRGRW